MRKDGEVEMTDMKKVMSHLQIIHTWASFARERDLQFFTTKHLEDMEQWTGDALAMLNEPKESKWIDHLYRFNDTRFECKSCHRTAAKSYPFCPWCGLAMNGVEIEADFV